MADSLLKILGSQTALLLGTESAAVTVWMLVVLSLRSVLASLGLLSLVPHGLVFALPLLMQLVDSVVPFLGDCLPLLSLRITETVLGRIQTSKLAVMIPAHFIGCVLGAVVFKTLVPIAPVEVSGDNLWGMAITLAHQPTLLSPPLGRVRAGSRSPPYSCKPQWYDGSSGNRQSGGVCVQRLRHFRPRGAARQQTVPVLFVCADSACYRGDVGGGWSWTRLLDESCCRGCTLATAGRADVERCLSITGKHVWSHCWSCGGGAFLREVVPG